MAEEQKTRQIIRILNTDLPGSVGIKNGLSKIKGIGANLSHTICVKMGLDPLKKVNSFSNDELKALEIKLKEMEGIDNWMLNRQKDFDSGENKHLLTTNLNLTFQFDKKRLQKIKSYRGLRLAAGLPVRGQRTKAHFRKGGKAVGVKRKGKK
jgi:small subunit ribosomal protein S13